MRKFLVCVAMLVSLAACGAEPIWAPEEDVQRAMYSPVDEPTSITLFTVISNGTNTGAHSGLMINGSQRIIFDPAGTWYHPSIPERNDVHFGATDRVVRFYEDYHARETYRVVTQTRQVSPEVAEAAMRIAMNYGAVPKAMCSNSVSHVLGQLPGFENMKRSWFPKKTMATFGAYPGVETYTVYDHDDDDNQDLLRVQGESPL